MDRQAAKSARLVGPQGHDPKFQARVTELLKAGVKGDRAIARKLHCHYFQVAVARALTGQMAGAGNMIGYFKGWVAKNHLLAEARSARERAYAPYSRFLVGAAVATDAGVFTGGNVENASYSVTICAERVAAASAVAAGARRLDVMAVTSSSPTPTPPCGACRQFLYEFNPEMLVVSAGRSGDLRQWRLSAILADAFGREDLEEGS